MAELGELEKAEKVQEAVVVADQNGFGSKYIFARLVSIG